MKKENTEPISLCLYIFKSLFISPSPYLGVSWLTTCITSSWLKKGKKLAKNPRNSKRELITIKNLKVNADA
jgi:hypothetical protein